MSKFRTQFTTPVVVGVDTGDQVLTDPSFARDCDIPSILSKHAAGVRLADWQLNPRTPKYGDVSNLPLSPEESHARIEMAREDFDGYPAVVKAYFDNDVNKFLAALYADKIDFEDLGKALAEGRSPKDKLLPVDPVDPVDPVEKTTIGE